MTSLSQQLRNLAVPQTSGLADLKKRASILFEPKEAATKDRKTIYDLGSQGLVELIALNHDFAQFEDTLFQHTSIYLERSVEKSGFNQELDKNIHKFFFHLSPYFMLRSAHMCLEWLIRRFQVHEYNKDAIMCLILPYHETNIFVKCVQVLKLKNHSDKWNWLYTIQKPGVKLPKSTIINRVANDPSFLSLICRNVIDATKELGTRACTLQCLINFYCFVIIGVFESCSEIKEWHVTTVLPSVLKGMKSEVIDYVSASIMITSELVSKKTLTKNLLNALVSNICKIECEKLKSSVILLLSLITKTQSDVFINFPNESFTDFISKKWLTTTVSTLSREGISIHHIVLSLIKAAGSIIQHNGSKANACKRFLENMFYEVQLPTCAAKSVIGLVLETFSFIYDSKKIEESNIIDLESDSEMLVDESIQDWYSKIIQNLERQYPNELDEIIKGALRSDEGNSSQNALKVFLSTRYKFIDAETSPMFQNMYHANPKIRLISVQEIVKHIKQNNSKNNRTQDYKNYIFLKETLADRIKDDNEQVVEEILKLPTNLFVEILGCKSFVENIFEILDKANMHQETWRRVQSVALTHMTSDIVVKNYDNNLILLSIMQYMFPVNNNEESAQYINLILHSSLTENMPFLRNSLQKYKTKNVNPIDFKTDFLNVMAVSNNAPHAESLIESIQNNGHNYFKTATHASYFLMMVTACFKVNNAPEKTHNILKFTMAQCNCFRITQFHKNQWTSTAKSNKIPLQLFMDFLQNLVRGTNFDNLLDWELPTKSLELFLEIFNLLSSKAFSIQLGENEKREWAKCLKDILNIIFLTPKNKINFLSQFLLYDNVSNIENFVELRIRSIILLKLILKGDCKIISPDLKFILKIIVALSSPLSIIRGCSLQVLRELQPEIEWKDLVDKVLERSEEIQFDAEQVPLILYSILTGKNKNTNLDNGFLAKVLSVIEEPKESIIFKSKVLEVLKHIKDGKILRTMVPLALNALSYVTVQGNISVLDRYAASIFKSVMKRLDENCIQEIITTDKEAWNLIDKSLKMSKTFTNHTEKRIPIPSITLEIFDEITYNQLPTEYKVKLIKLIIETILLSDNDVLFLDINKALRRCCLDCRHVLPVLASMSNVCGNAKTQQKKRIAYIESTDEINLITTCQWKEGVILLEILENKKKLQNTFVLIPILFDILKKCLDMENQSPLEYTKQLILSALLRSCQKSNAGKLLEDIPKNIFRMDLIVQCIRVTQNPQTHYNALLLLSHCAIIFPQQVLHNLVDIFTFMGSSIARHDDAFSFQIISNIVESIIPILVKDKACSTVTAPINDLVVPVLKIFSDILLDVPEHRRIPLYSKLLHTLGAENHFWLFLCVVFESHVIHEDKNKLSGKKSNHQISTATTSTTDKLPQRIEITLQLLHKFSTNISLQTCISLMGYVKNLPMNKDEISITTNICLRKTLESPDLELFDVTTRTAKQLRHFKYLILQFVSTFTSSEEFIKATSALDKKENKSAKSLYQHFIIKTLSYIPEVSSAIEKSIDSSQSKFWKVILHHCYDILDNVISLLSPDMFLVVVHGLMQHQLITIRKKVIEMLISKLQLKNDYFENCTDENILNLLSSLYEIISNIPGKDRQYKSILPSLTPFNTNEMIFLQQACLIAVKLLSKRFSLKYIEQFKNIVVVLTNVTKKRSQISKIILSTAILTLIEVTSNLKAYSISHLPKFMPHMVGALNDQATILQRQAPDNVCLALITGTQKLFEAMPLFLGPYIVGIITALSKISSLIPMNGVEHEQRKNLIINKLHLIWSKIAKEVPARILIPSCERAYYMLMNERCYSGISSLMKLFLECISTSSNLDLSIVQIDFTNFFLKTLEFRTQVSNFIDSTTILDEIRSIEKEIINTFVAWILKLSESSFKPVYRKVYDWTFSSNSPKERVLTYFILNRFISNSLKSLFVLFAGEFIQNAAELLNDCNTSKNGVLYFSNSEMLNRELITNILCTLTNIFLHDSKCSVNPHRFDLLMQPIVDQLENKLVQDSDELQNILSSCIGQLAVAVSNDVLWKQLNYQILLKTRTNIPQIRIAAFNCCVELARKLGDDFTSLLPETIPFVAELFEDENPEVVKKSKKAVQELETILGESLQKYL